MQWLSLFKEMNAVVKYAATASKSDFSEDLSSYVDEELQVKVNDSSFDEFIQTYQPDIVLYDRFMVEEQFSWRIRENAPDALHLLETQDLHFLREARIKQETLYSTTCKRELASILRCDLTSIISTYELELLWKEFPFVADKVTYFPLCYMPQKEFISYENRKDFCFIGNFLHHPNREAVIWLKKNWKAIRAILPSAKIHIYGAYPTQQIKEMHNEKEGFIIHGRADNVATVFQQHAYLLSPIQTGAGLKGKLLEAMQYGILSITTPIGSEGISHDKWNGKQVELSCFIDALSDLPKKQEYAKFQEVGRKILTEKFQFLTFQTEIIQQLNQLLLNLSDWRTTHFLGEIMNYHRVQSVRYLSKWIAEKGQE